MTYNVLMGTLNPTHSLTHLPPLDDASRMATSRTNVQLYMYSCSEGYKLYTPI